jgi:hypothetical protein
MGDAFDELFAKSSNTTLERWRVVAYAARYADLAASDQTLEPGRDVYAIAEDVPLL